MAAMAKKVWVEAIELDGQGQAFSDAIQFTILDEHLITLTLEKDVSEGLQMSLDVEKQNIQLGWDALASLAAVGEELTIDPGAYRVSSHLYGGTANAEGEFYGEMTFTVLPYSDLDS